MVHLRLSLAALALVASCTKENAAFCCLTEADCAANGVNELRTCTDGLACVGNTCVAPTCTTNGCGVEAPVCEIATDQCVGCTDSSQCSIFTTTPVCDTSSGGCVQCKGDGDCNGTTPVCDDNACRRCERDDECPSGACAEDGACVPEANAVYVAPAGQDVVPCSRAAPCASLYFALEQATESRNHLVLAPAVYTINILDLPGGANVSMLAVHGNEAVLEGGSTDGFVRVFGTVHMKDLELRFTDTQAATLFVGGFARLERVRLRGETGLQVGGRVLGVDVDVQVSKVGISSGGVVELDRLRTSGGENAIRSTGGSLMLTNAVLSETSNTAVVAAGTTGSISFSTIANTGRATTETTGVRCETAAMSIRASIIWTPSRPGLAVYGSCTIHSSIVGPAGVVGATNVDPLFVNSNAGDFHLSGGSPARDVVDSGPSMDFDGAPRPAGPRFDLGAYEIQ